MVQILALDLVDAGQQGVEVVIDAEMPPRQLVCMPGGEAQYQLGRPGRISAAAVFELLADPSVHLRLADPGGALLARAASDRPMGVIPGWTLNTLTPARRVSSARFSVNFTTAALETEYADTCGHRYTPARLVTLTIRPLRRATMSGSTRHEQRKTLRRFTSMVRHQASGSTSQASPTGPQMPALLTSRSTGPS